MKPRMTDVVLPPTFEQTASFTTGPWRSQGWVPTWAYIPVHDARHNLVASLYPNEHRNYSRNEVEANASLIAAAPELLAALKECLPWVSGNVSHMSADKLNGIADRARKAITKAGA